MIGAPLTLEVVACTRVNRKPAAWAMARKLASSAGFRSSHESSTRVAAKVPADGDEEQWRAMEALVRKGLVDKIGVSNFSRKKLEALLKHCEIKPSKLVKQK